jgi:hypothetical protein
MVGGLVRCQVEALQSEFKNWTPVRNLLVKYPETLLSQLQQSVA